MLHGWAGANLEIDLSRGNIEEKETDRKLAEAFLGGKGTNAKILWDRLPPEVGAFSPDNLLIVGTGVLAGTIVPAANRTTITFKSPVTEIYSYSNLGGFFAPELKRAGYDTIIFSGKSPTPVYVWINNGQVEIRNASHLWGKDTHETQRLVREELEEDKVQILCIGPAGENRVYTSTIQHGNGSSAGRGGAGAIMGDKKIKAIAVRGTKDISVANPSRLIELCKSIRNRTELVRNQIYDRFGYARVQGYVRRVDFGTGINPLSPELQQKIDSMGKTAQDFIDARTVKRVTCYRCPQRCFRAVANSDGGYSYLKCSHWVAGMRATRILDLDFGLAFYYLCEKYGLDVKAITNQIAFAIKLYEKGILTKEDTGGMHLEFENPDVALSLIEKITRREGIGDVLADGVYQAAQRIGRGAEEFARHVKKLDLVPSREGGTMRPGVLTTAIADAGGAEKLGGSTPGFFWQSVNIQDPKDREAYLKSEYFQFPEEFKKYLPTKPDPSGDDYEGTLRFISYNEESNTLADMTGLCNFWVGYHPSPPIGRRPLIADLISTVTGMDIDEAGVTKLAKRIISLVRAYDVRAGIRRKDDSLPESYFQTPTAPGQRTPDRSLFNKWVDMWYELKGLNNEGIPTKETLEELGLDDVRQELEQRKILA